MIEENKNTKYDYNMLFILIRVDIINSLNDININHLNFITHRNNVRKLFINIIRNIRNISVFYPIIVDKEKIKIIDNNKKTIEYETGMESRESIKKYIDNLDNSKLFTDKDESSKKDILYNVDIVKLIDDYKNVIDLLFREFNRLNINIIQLH